MNIILVIFDTLRKDCVGVYGSPPWGRVRTPHFDAFADESVVLTRAFPESLPTLPARRAIYTGQRVYPFRGGDIRLKGDFIGAPGWGPIPEEQSTLAEMLGESGYRTGLISDVPHMFKPSKNFWRGFDQWMFLRGQSTDRYRSGPHLTQGELDYWLPMEMQDEVAARPNAPDSSSFVQQCVINIHGRTKEDDFFAPRVFKESALWLEQNQDSDRVFLTVECFDPHEPWLVPAHYSRLYLKEARCEVLFVPSSHHKVLFDSNEQEPHEHELAESLYDDTLRMNENLLARIHANYSGLVSLCDRWFGYFMESMRVLGMLDDTMLIFTSDHGHSIGDGDYMGKRGYPSAREVFDVPLMVRLPGAKHAGVKSDMFVTHTDITAEILKQTDVAPPEEIDGISFLEDAVKGRTGVRDHVTIGWGSTPTVITDRWWFNCKVDGTGILLHDLNSAEPFTANVSNDNQDVAKKLFLQAKVDAGGSFPDWLVELAINQTDAPGCSEIVARNSFLTSRR